jgi:hypothetical protein
MRKLILLLSLVLMAVATPLATRQVHASGLTGVVLISPPAINSTQYSVGSVFRVTVQVSGMDVFYGWDVSVRTNPLVISPVNASFAGDLFEANYSIPADRITEPAYCINGNCFAGQPRGTDGPGVAHLAVALFPVPSSGTIVPPIRGTIFTITYMVISASGFSPIEIIDSTFQNGTPTPVPNTIGHRAVYGTERRDFGVTANPRNLNLYQESNVTTTVTVESFVGFAGMVNLTVSKELRTVLAQRSLIVPANGTVSTQLTFVALANTTAYDYSKITVIASNATLSHSGNVEVLVITFPDFLLEITPSLLRIHAGKAANTTIIVQSQNGFSGNVTLTVQVPANVTYVLSPSRLALKSNGSSQANLNISTPVLALPFVYHVNVTAVSPQSNVAGSPLLVQTRTLDIKPPAPSFTIIINPATIVVRAGLTSSVTITVGSVDYFWQYVYLSATMSGGAASFDSNSYYVPLPNSKYASVTESVNFTLSVYVPIDQVPGHYIVLLTVYQSPLTQTIGIPVVITSLSPFHSASNPTILGLTPLIYFGILGALVIPFIALSINTYRKAREEEDDDWKA